METVVSCIFSCFRMVKSCLAACWAGAVLCWQVWTTGIRYDSIGDHVPAVETIHFMLYKSIPGQGEVFQEVAETAPQPGDILLFPLSSYGSCSSLFRHAAVCCGDAEVIHFQNTDVQNNVGQVSKEGFCALRRERGSCLMYRKRDGIDLKEFHGKVREAMHSTGSYYPGTNNCIHFALWLLGLEGSYMHLVEVSDEDGRGRLLVLGLTRTHTAQPSTRTAFASAPIAVQHRSYSRLGSALILASLRKPMPSLARTRGGSGSAPQSTIFRTFRT
ncbi:uncharacterized protein LOC135182772 [Pogoniulus pusillus]|uniref:uncharacterized protein LOC135182772 n=1 Tax=Pogoniulus pusillus TaxID=488313 RepID=UPI0030B92C64